MLVLYAAPLFAAAPYSHTQPATLITSNSATFNGMAVPNGMLTTAWFEWGNRGSYDQITSAVDVGNGTAVIRVSAAVSGLTNGGVYQCRLVVSNSSGVVSAAPQIFTTGKRVAHWGGAFSGLTNVPPGLTNVVAIACGGQHNLGLKAMVHSLRGAGTPPPTCPLD